MIGVKNSVDPTFGVHGNYRPIQPLAGRTVYKTTNVQSFSCPSRGTLEPKWSCVITEHSSSASSLASGAAVALVAAVMSLTVMRV